MEQKKQANFGHFRIDCSQGVFYKNTTKIKLHPKELSVLWLLVKNSGYLVTKEQIINKVWAGFPASDESIARCISVIKARLRVADPYAENLIKTEYGRGYRFIGNVSFEYDKQPVKENKKSIIGSSTIGEIASKDILSCDVNTTLLEVANLMITTKKSSIIVLRDSKPVGIWTETDALSLDLTDPNVLEIKIKNVMKSPIISIEDWRPIAEAVTLMRSNNIHHLIIIDKAGKVCGVASQSDIIYSHGIESFMTVKDVKSIAHKSPLLITENMLVSDIVYQMRIKNTNILIIQLEQRAMFSFTEHDLINSIATNSFNILIGDLNLPKLTTIKEETSIFVARQLMDIKKIKHLAVLDKQENFTKILSLSDILANIEHSYIQLIEEILENNKDVSENGGYTQLLANAMRQTAGMMIITDKHGDIEYVNDSFEKISGYKIEEIKGKNPRFLSSGIIPKSVFRNMWETLTLGKIWKGELCNQKKSGEIYWVLSSISPIVDDNGDIHHFIAVEEDISERKEVEKRLLEIEKRFYEMVDHSLVMIWESEQNGKVIFLNKNWLEFTGRNLTEQLGNRWAEQLHPDDLQNFLDAFQGALIKRSPFCLDHRLKNAIGEYRWVMNFVMPRINKDGDFLGFRGTCIDITERKIREIEALL